ncbi:hypothetical protein TVAG_050370 [Trichomonas vaginalis G3]|uniref:Uncharacterized protein n=1 Tax=Trichomonas vaginalis (strain ATCC PRA-98 / G3) TaxID=412133 RepID=A2EJG4_TRIV3|nr:hypothetical protein TVAGG3_0389750 [Trichomonas vaginalis G3]EAY07221.1 hypothetical protein TVAG_050370 [Trichomonas vaginalis G3]KAI5533909.1 hypothetical protein TVAGG3_0389750 [Trichomonas vaginalis G3]|eukprot:XP_001319444.1 hypothetical protein [Trichomonas vaginalis G3]
MSFLWKFLGLSEEESKKRQRESCSPIPEPHPFADAVRKPQEFSINPMKISEKSNYSVQAGPSLSKFKDTSIETDISVPTDYRPNWDEEFREIAINIRRSFDRASNTTTNTQIVPKEVQNEQKIIPQVVSPAPTITEIAKSENNTQALQNDNDSTTNQQQSEESKESTTESSQNSTSSSSTNSSSSQSDTESQKSESQESSESEHEEEKPKEPEPVRKLGFANLRPVAPKQKDSDFSTFDFSMGSASKPETQSSSRQLARSDSDSSDSNSDSDKSDSDSDSDSSSDSDSDSNKKKSSQPEKQQESKDTGFTYQDLLKKHLDSKKSQNSTSASNNSASGFNTDFSKKRPPSSGFSYKGYKPQTREKGRPTRGRGGRSNYTRRSYNNDSDSD